MVEIVTDCDEFNENLLYRLAYFRFTRSTRAQATWQYYKYISGSAMNSNWLSEIAIFGYFAGNDTYKRQEIVWNTGATVQTTILVSNKIVSHKSGVIAMGHVYGFLLDIVNWFQLKNGHVHPYHSY